MQATRLKEHIRTDATTVHSSLAARRNGREKLKRDDSTVLDSAQLRELVERLQRQDSDVRARLSRRATALGDWVEPMDDPVYHRLHFVLKGLEAQRTLTQSELAARQQLQRREERALPLGRLIGNATKVIRLVLKRVNRRGSGKTIALPAV